MEVKKYLSCAETAKLIRAALKESFPGVKFSVRSSVYSGGASISIRYTDGPQYDLVNNIADQFEGSYFDGMIDYKGNRTHTLDGEQVSLGADFVFVTREHSDEALEAAVRTTADYWGIELEGDPVELYRNGKLWNVGVGQNGLGHQDFMRYVGEALNKAGTTEVQESATLKRLAFYGDDGYGQGTSGMPGGDGGDQCYKAISANLDRRAAERREERE